MPLTLEAIAPDVVAVYDTRDDGSYCPDAECSPSSPCTACRAVECDACGELTSNRDEQGIPFCDACLAEAA